MPSLTTNPAIRAALTRGASGLELTPDAVARPASAAGVAGLPHPEEHR